MNITNFIGNTPLVRLNNYEPGSADIYVKMEYFNAGASIKARVAKQMVQDALENGQLHKDITILEPTGGNTGVGLAIMSIIYGYQFIAVVPDNYSQERIDLLRYYNAKVVLSDSLQGNDSHINKAKELLLQNPSWICLDQFKNNSCIAAHFEGTGQEILDEIVPDAFVACVGSGGTFTGVSKRLKENDNTVKCYVAQPNGCDIISGRAVKHQIQGVSLGIIPPLLDYSLIDGTIDIDFNDVREELRSLVKTQALFLGISAGANIVAAKKLARKMGPGKIICTVAPDSGQYYVKEIYAEDVYDSRR